MTVLKDALQYLVSLGLEDQPALELDGRLYTVRELRPVLDPRPSTIQVHSLAGLVDYCNALLEFDHQTAIDEAGEIVVHIVGPREVRLVTCALGPHRQRAVYCSAEPADGGKFPFATYFGVEEFVIALQAQFCDAFDRKAILALAGTVSDDAVRTMTDDGVTQAVSARRGIRLLEEAKVPNPVTLAPYRTFPDIAQPEGLYVLRFKGGAGEPVKIALFEVDDGQWRRRSIELIKGFFSEQETMKDIPVIG